MLELLGTALLAASVWSPQRLSRARSAIDTALAAPTLRGAHVGLLAVDAATGAPLYARGADDDFVPASTFKLLVGSAALARLGAAFAFTTEVAVQGGTVYLRGGGDAHLAMADLDAAAAAVAASGLREAALAGDATRYAAPRYPPGWSIDDLPYGYAAVPSALSFDENIAHVSVVPGDATGAPAGLRVQPVDDATVFDNAIVTGDAGSPDTTDIERPWDRPMTIRLTGSYPLGAAPSDDMTPAVPDPPLRTLDLFRQALERHGVAIVTTALAATPPGALVVWRHESAELPQLLAQCWQPSDNLMGELLLLELGYPPAPQAGSDTRERGIATERLWLRSIGVEPATLTIADGSGLSEYDRITPRDLVAILEADWKGPARTTVLDALPLAGVRGTLASHFGGTPLAGNLFAKTGTLSHARLLAGYLRTAHHGTVAFALMVNDWMDASPHAAAALDAARAALLEALE